MPELVRMGARVSIAHGRQPLGWSAAEVVAVDDAGNELVQAIRDEPGLMLSVVQFVDLSDGRRVTTEAFGEMSMTVPRQYTVVEPSRRASGDDLRR